MKFLKPTKEKIILSLIFLIAPIIDFFTGINISTKITNVLFFPAKFFYVQGSRTMGDVQFPPALHWIIITVIIGLIWGYLLSSIIIYLYKRLKK